MFGGSLVGYTGGGSADPLRSFFGGSGARADQPRRAGLRGFFAAQGMPPPLERHAAPPREDAFSPSSRGCGTWARGAANHSRGSLASYGISPEQSPQSTRSARCRLPAALRPDDAGSESDADVPDPHGARHAFACAAAVGATSQADSVTEA